MNKESILLRRYISAPSNKLVRIRQQWWQMDKKDDMFSFKIPYSMSFSRGKSYEYIFIQKI